MTANKAHFLRAKTAIGSRRQLRIRDGLSGRFKLAISISKDGRRLSQRKTLIDGLADKPERRATGKGQNGAKCDAHTHTHTDDDSIKLINYTMQKELMWQDWLAGKRHAEEHTERFDRADEDLCRQ